MTNILLPLQITAGKLSTTEKVMKSIDSFLSLLITTSQNDSVSARKFGFVFNNLRFEIFNENEGVVYDSSLEEDAREELVSGIYEKKISGSSKNLNTFAAELREAIIKYEKRLQDVSVSISYIREERLLYELVITSKDLILPVDAVLIHPSGTICYCPKKDISTKKAEEYLNGMLGKWKLNKNARVITEERTFLKRLGAMPHACGLSEDTEGTYAAELLKEDYEVQTAVVHPQTAEGKHAYVTKIDISSLGETFTAQGTERLIADRQALVLASSGNAAIVLMADDEGEPACYITLADALEMTAYTPADNDMDKAYARSEVTIFTRPYMCDATVADTVESGTVFTVLEKCSLELTDGAFYRVEYTAEGQTKQGFAVGRSLSPYTFAAENDTEQTTGDKNFTYDNPWQTVVAVLLIVLLVLVGVGYVTFYATKKSAKANKKQVPPSDDDLYMRD